MKAWVTLTWPLQCLRVISVLLGAHIGQWLKELRVVGLVVHELGRFKQQRSASPQAHGQTVHQVMRQAGKAAKAMPTDQLPVTVSWILRFFDFPLHQVGQSPQTRLAPLLEAVTFHHALEVNGEWPSILLHVLQEVGRLKIVAFDELVVQRDPFELEEVHVVLQGVGDAFCKALVLRTGPPSKFLLWNRRSAPLGPKTSRMLILGSQKPSTATHPI